MNPFPSLPINQNKNVHHSFVLRRNARIKCHKLPSDFFAPPFTPTTTPQHQTLDFSTRQLQTPSFMSRSRRNSIFSKRGGEQRKVETARTSIDKNFQAQTEMWQSNMLPYNVTQRESKKKEHFKERYSTSMDSKNVRLPKILKKALINQGWTS